MDINLLKESVYKANIALVKHGLVLFTWGNVSAIDRKNNIVVIKPSGVPYETMKPADMVVVDMDGNIVEGNLKPSVDLQTHLELYRRWENVNSVVHTHSTYATSWAQACRPIPCYGGTHADYFYGAIPCTRPLNKEEVSTDYEKNSGRVIVEHVGNNNPLDIPAILIANHGPFAWGQDANTAVHNAAFLEQVAKMAMHTETINPKSNPAAGFLLETHFLRKHGKGSYYGQNPNGQNNKFAKNKNKI